MIKMNLKQNSTFLGKDVNLVEIKLINIFIRKDENSTYNNYSYVDNSIVMFP